VEFDHVVVNEDLATATEAVRAVLRGARCATGRLSGLAGFVEGLG
jgi:guanylate kinase